VRVRVWCLRLPGRRLDCYYVRYLPLLCHAARDALHSTPPPLVLPFSARICSRPATIVTFKMAGHNDPRLLYSIPNIHAYHIQNGTESPLTPSGSQTLSLLMVPTSSPFADLSNAGPQNDLQEEDFYLHLNLPPELDLPLPATTQIYHQPPNSYLIPRWDLGPDSGAFTRIEFPGVGREPGQVSQEDVDTFETILAQCTAFLERASPPTAARYGKEKAGKGAYAPPKYNPADYGPGEGYALYGGGNSGDPTPPHQHGHIVLIDEENGSVVGELSEGFQVVEDPNLKAGSKSMRT
jgi:spartin